MNWLDYKIEPFRPKTLALIGIAILLSAIAMWPCLDNDFTNWDDGKYIMENDLVKDLTASNVYKMFFEKDLKGRSYVPLSLVTWAIEYDIWQDDPAPYHRHNLILHLCNIALVFFFILFITSRVEISFITAVLFGIHPMHVESVAWITERKDVLYTFFYFSSLICYVKYLKQGANSMRLYFFTLILFFLSTTAKSSAVTLTGVLLLLDFLAHRKLDRKLVFEKVPFFIITVVMGIITVIAAQSTDTIASAEAFSIFERFMFASYGMITYIAKMVVPFHLAAYYPY
ncbi:MAG: hypothetical protein IH948_02205, partial [Bacteroidetes bacterium]|nr:hypothetical protein [Bacteroidota bacterium]